jgi:DNA replication licensing factor MCM3
VCVLLYCYQNDRVAIHEVMEQQTVTIAKAGMHASLNARCSVVAAANPVYGQYDRSRRPQENIGLPDSLLSRFDLLFIVLDQIDPVLDRRLSEHVIKSHQYRRAGTSMEPEPLNQSASSISLLTEGGGDGDEVDMNGDSQKDAVVWQRGGRGSDSSVGDGRAGDVLTKGFLRKYLHFAKSQIKPVLSDAAMDSISTAFAGMRAKRTDKNLPVTARSLETVIRLSSAHAKARLSNSVDDEDVDLAMELMNFVMFHEVGVAEPESGGGRAGQDAGSSGSGNGVGRGVRRGREGDTSGDDDDENDEDVQSKRSRVEAEEDGYDGKEVDSDSPRFKKIQSTISKLAQTLGLDLIQVDELQTRLNADSGGGQSFGTEEISKVLIELERQNKVFFASIYKHINDTLILFYKQPTDYVFRGGYPYLVKAGVRILLHQSAAIVNRILTEL